MKKIIVFLTSAFVLMSCSRTIYTPGLKQCDERGCHRVISVTVSEKGVYYKVAR